MRADQLAVVVKELETHVKNMRSELDKMSEAHERLREKHDELDRKLVGTERDLRSHIAHVEKWDARRWTTIGFFIAGLVSLVANLVVVLVRK